jgi:hypothetical protein
MSLLSFHWAFHLLHGAGFMLCNAFKLGCSWNSRPCASDLGGPLFWEFPSSS